MKVKVRLERDIDVEGDGFELTYIAEGCKRYPTDMEVKVLIGLLIKLVESWEGVENVRVEIGQTPSNYFGVKQKIKVAQTIQEQDFNFVTPDQLLKDVWEWYQSTPSIPINLK